MNFQPFPVLNTERLLLRRIEHTDKHEVFFLRSDDAVMQYLHKDKETSVDSALEWIDRIQKNTENNESIAWGMALPENPDKLIGYICLWQMQPENNRCEIGYAMHPSYWGKGFMKEAVHCVLEYGLRTLGLHSVEAHINPDNKASAKLLVAAGFSREAHFRENLYYQGRYWDTMVYSKILNPSD